MDKALIAVTSGSRILETETAESVPEMVQTSPTGGNTAVYILLILITINLIVLTAVVVIILLNQKKLGEQAEKILKLLKAAEYLSEKRSKKETEKQNIIRNIQQVVSDAIPENKTAPASERLSDSGERTKETKTEKKVLPDRIEQHSDSSSEGLDNMLDTIKNSEKALQKDPGKICGLKVSDVSNYTQDSVTLDETSEEEAIFLLFSDLSVRPNEKKIQHYTNPEYFTENGFTRIFDLTVKGDYDADMKHRMKFAELREPAKVKEENGKYILVEKGILKMEEKT